MLVSDTQMIGTTVAKIDVRHYAKLTEGLGWASSTFSVYGCAEGRVQGIPRRLVWHRVR